MRILFRSIALLLITSVLLELTSVFLFKLLTGDSFSYQTIGQERAKRMQHIEKDVLYQFQRNQRSGNPTGMYNLHPYLGFSGRPGFSQNFMGVPFNEYGFQSNEAFPLKKEKDDYMVGILGGSVASVFAVLAGDDLTRELRLLDPAGFKDKKIKLVNLAIAGYKQPQQVFALIYSMLMDLKFDMIINIDGFNELVLTVENYRHGVNPVYPSVKHFLFISKKINGWDSASIDHLMFIRKTYKKEQKVLRWVERFSFSPFMNLLGHMWTQDTIGKINAGNVKISENIEQQVLDDFIGPKPPSGINPLNYGVEHWVSSTLLINTIAKSKNIPYLHVLQPNQYVAGSKPLTPKELETAYRPDDLWSRIAAKGYPLLIKQGKILKEYNFPFYDLTDVFKDVDEDIYTDVCCHFAIRGNQILAKGVARSMVAELKRLNKKKVKG